MKITPEGNTPLTECEIVDSKILAERLRVSVAWVKKQCLSAAENRIPHLKFGKCTRFLWGSPDLCKWLEGRYQK